MIGAHSKYCTIYAMPDVRGFLPALYKEWKRDDVLHHAAAISYYAVFTLPATLLITLSIASTFLDEQRVKLEFFEAVRLYIGDRTTQLLEQTITQIQSSGSASTWATAIGSIVLILVAGNIIRELRRTLDTILGNVQSKTSFVLWLWNYLLSYLLLIATGLVLAASIFSGAILKTLQTEFAELSGFSFDTLNFIHSTVSYGSVTILFFLLYLLLPARRYPPLIVLLGSIIASALLVIGTVIASFYIAKANLGHAYGLAANVLILLFWIYFSSAVFLSGAELIDVVSKSEGITPQKRFSHLKHIARRK